MHSNILLHRTPYLATPFAGRQQSTPLYYPPLGSNDTENRRHNKSLCSLDLIFVVGVVHIPSTQGGGWGVQRETGSICPISHSSKPAIITPEKWPAPCVTLYNYRPCAPRVPMGNMEACRARKQARRREELSGLLACDDETTGTARARESQSTAISWMPSRCLSGEHLREVRARGDK